MFYYLNGTVAYKEANLAVVDCAGVGYACRTTSYTLSQLTVGEKAKLYTYTNIREDAIELFGFSTREELRYFTLLLGVSGVGPKAALSILSSLTPDRLTLAVVTGDEKAITVAPGVGKKMAQRVLLELKDKLGSIAQEGSIVSSGVSVPIEQNTVTLAMAALAELGYSQAEISAVMKGLTTEGKSTEQLVKEALLRMMQG